MADWTSIPDATFDPDRPVLGSTHLAIVKNFEALAEGATGAPRLVGKAVARLIDMPVLAVTASDAFDADTGSARESLTLETSSTDNPPTVVAYRYTIETYTGSMRFKVSHRMNSLGITFARLSLYKNNTLVQAYTTNLETNVERTNDVSIVPGDVLEWRHSVGSSSRVSLVSLASVTASDAYTTRPLFIAQSDNGNP